MFQPIQIETQSEQQSLAHLRAQGSTSGACREFPFDRREQALDQGAAAGKSVAGMPAASRRGLRAGARFSYRARRELHALRSECV